MVEKEAGLFESLNRFPAAELPPYLLVGSSGLEGSALYRELVAGEPLFRSFSLSDDLLVYRARWDVLGRNRRLYRPEALEAVAGLTEVDHLNVCDGQDESAHGYAYESRRGDLRLSGAVHFESYALEAGREDVADAGRPILGSERFRVKTRAGRDLVIAFRTLASVQGRTSRSPGNLTVGFQTHTIEMPEAGFILRAGGRTLPALVFKNGPGWNEHVFRVPREAVSDGATELQLTGRYASFYYWFYQ
jgi:hypothetical protein